MQGLRSFLPTEREFYDVPDVPRVSRKRRLET